MGTQIMMTRALNDVEGKKNNLLHAPALPPPPRGMPLPDIRCSGSGGNVANDDGLATATTRRRGGRRIGTAVVGIATG